MATTIARTRLYFEEAGKPEHIEVSGSAQEHVNAAARWVEDGMRDWKGADFQVQAYGFGEVRATRLHDGTLDSDASQTGVVVLGRDGEAKIFSSIEAVAAIVPADEIEDAWLLGASASDRLASLLAGPVPLPEPAETPQAVAPETVVGVAQGRFGSALASMRGLRASKVGRS